MRRLALFLAALLVAVGLPAIGHASNPATSYFAPYRFRTSVICLETNGWTRWPFVEVAAQLDATPDLHVVARASCAAYPDNQKTRLRTYSSSEYACAKVAISYSGGYVTSAVIWMNMWPGWFAGCHATAAQRAHLIAHEVMHPLGFRHCSCASVMGGWRYTRLTPLDREAIEKRYPG